MEEDNLKLGFVNYVGKENDGNNLYEFVFIENTEEFWGEGFEYKPSCLYNDIKPDEGYVVEIKTIRTDINLDLIQNNCCFGMQDALDGIVAIAYQSLDGLDEYPEDGRLFFMFGEPYSKVERKLAIKSVLFDD